MSKQVTTEELDQFINRNRPTNDFRGTWPELVKAYRIARDLKNLRFKVQEALEKNDLSILKDDSSGSNSPPEEKING